VSTQGRQTEMNAADIQRQQLLNSLTHHARLASITDTIRDLC